MNVKAEIDTFKESGMRLEGSHLTVQSHPRYLGHADLISITLNGETVYVLSSQLKKAIQSCTGLVS